MSLVIRIGKGPEGLLKFGDDVDLIVLGRDPDRCQVVFPADQTLVGREHCALQRVLGRYRLVLNGDNHVVVDGQDALDGMELPPACQLQLGRGGPRIVVKRALREGMLRTMAQGKRQDLPDIVRATRSTARRNTVIGILAILGLGAAAWFGYKALQSGEASAERNRAEIEAAQRDRAALRGDLARIDSGLSEVGAEVHAALEGMETKFDAVEAEVARLGPRVQEALEAARDSVYLVVARRPDGLEDGRGTAWVVGDGLLATNSHVAEEYEKLAGFGLEMLVRSPGAEPRTFKVKEVRMHPGYESFSRIWGGYRPVSGTDLKDSRDIEAAGAGCDVALLVVEDPDDELAPPLEVATAEEARRIAQGDVIGFVGYPMENMVLAGTPVTRPAPQMQVGNITSLTDYFGVFDPSADQGGQHHLVQHSCPAAGGASGSPMIGAEGKVIAILSGGNVVPVPMLDDRGQLVLDDQGRPARSLRAAVAGVGFAQRVDLLHELLDDRAAEVQAERDRAWDETLQRLYRSGYLLQRDATLEEMLKGVAAQLARQSGQQQSYDFEEVSKKEVDADGETPHVLKVEEEGTYVFTAVASRGVLIEMEAEVTFEDGGVLPISDESRVGFVCLGLFRANGPGTVSVRLKTAGATLPATIRMHRANAKEVGPDDLRQQLVGNWLAWLERETGTRFTPTPLAEARQAIEAGGRWEGNVRVDPGGRFLLVAIAPDKSDIDLLVANDAGALGEDREIDHFPIVAFQLEDPGRVDLVVLGPPGTEVDLALFRATNP